MNIVLYGWKYFFCISYRKIYWKKVNYDFKVGQIWRETIFEGGSMWIKKLDRAPAFFLAADAHGRFSYGKRAT